MLVSLYPWIKVVHILAVIAWMAGMMYLPRLYVYHHQSKPGGEAEGLYVQMERRLLKGIMNPAMIATWIFGLLMIAAIPAYGSQPWFIIKFLAVISMSGVHGFYSASYKKFAKGERPRTEKFWRIMNEVPFLLLILIVIMVIVKPFG
ncbi:protoporphyrinogen oxidase HemJ [Parvularcula sp. LCG005]|uniref:protoporphyrinogen oxidase HemJ n=1 Tax=Parvularcula sp. LCG005 TaxID=3078805 RepID=UPI002942DA77|nr:protoporphyrinogen oxidase HemJ [Parvularcula sp. LCG005]WOI53310.1 protoporphyrinogen oxidase HemJ [Parvularcula sp. LCG005]